MGVRGSGAWRRAWPMIFLVMGASVLVLSGLGAFRGRDLAPAIFGGLWALGGLVRVVRRRHQERSGTALLVAGILCAALAPGAHLLAQRVESRRTERAAMAALAGRPAPLLEAAHHLNGAGDLATAPGELIVVNFWATWCQPCVAEMPMLQRFAKGHAPETVRLVGATRLYQASPEEELTRLERFLADRGVTYPCLVSADGALQKAFHVHTLPTTVLLDRGRVVAYRIGIRGTREVLAEAERRLVGR